MSGRERSAGGVVFRGGEVLLIRDTYGRWSFPKGHVEAGETDEKAAEREVFEETGITAHAVAPLADLSYPLPRQGDTIKDVKLFVMSFQSGRPRPLKNETMTARFMAFADAIDALGKRSYPGYDGLLRQARQIHERENTPRRA